MQMIWPRINAKERESLALLCLFRSGFLFRGLFRSGLFWLLRRLLFLCRLFGRRRGLGLGFRFFSGFCRGRCNGLWSSRSFGGRRCRQGFWLASATLRRRSRLTRSLFLGRSTAPHGRRRRRRLRRFVRLQVLHDLVVAAQLSIHEQEESVVQNFLVVRMLGRNPHLCHFRKWEFLPDLRPLGQKILELLLDCRRARGNCSKQYRFGTALHEKLPDV